MTMLAARTGQRLPSFQFGSSPATAALQMDPERSVEFRAATTIAGVPGVDP